MSKNRILKTKVLMTYHTPCVEIITSMSHANFKTVKKSISSFSIKLKKYNESTLQEQFRITWKANLLNFNQETKITSASD